MDETMKESGQTIIDINKFRAEKADSSKVIPFPKVPQQPTPQTPEIQSKKPKINILGK